MDGFPDIKVITIVWDVDTDDIDISYDEENISYYEAMGMVDHAQIIQREGLDKKDSEDNEDDNEDSE